MLEATLVVVPDEDDSSAATAAAPKPRKPGRPPKIVSPKAKKAKATAAATSEIRPAIVRNGNAVIACQDGYYYAAAIDGIKEGKGAKGSQFRVAWDDGDTPTWLPAGTSRLYAPGVLFDPDGEIPDAGGERTQHLAVYYSTAPADAADGPSCIGRATARWGGANRSAGDDDGVDDVCTPTLVWADDGAPLLCSEHGGGDARAFGAEPFYGFDGSLYNAVGYRPDSAEANEPGS